MEHFGSDGSYAGYNKNNKEREKLDYYATPPKEVTNILTNLQLDLEDSIILEPSCGGGHMIKGILDYQEPKLLIGADIKDRGFRSENPHIKLYYGEDFLKEESNKESYDSIDYVIMNPPFSLIEYFVKHSIKIAKKGILMLGRLQFLESKSRYDNILKDYPPTDTYIYVDRIACYKNGDFSLKPNSIQAYAWYYWNLENPDIPALHWIRRSQN